ncbi:ABC transporter ATP-binding protein [Pseudoclavibacter endophyticus]|uniref:Lipopolysaccharide export system ATP-binding protein LptB n=1 Tax=Pseudoclavibacter endophyticus TaxID=1778590 RepID=A0A6H9WHV9_9MICO|nr:ATP-binding cassette domain-containing protein [Pseudoclavibacter endophyticus]KAB1648893.1 branched-chain amino acid ABC transporter ATP-binding protein/permease [Pseudoclavibacter endophyticus]GGA67445.1 ABC transporter ATP-binding protein [Pseudoclavibacter endophyticus]
MLAGTSEAASPGTAPGEAASPGGRARRDARLGRLGVAGAAAAVVALLVLPFGVNPVALSIVTLGLVYGLFTYGLDLSWGRVGLISVGQAAFFGLGAYGVAIAERFGVSIVLGAVAGVLLAAGIGALVAALSLQVRGEKAVPLFILFTLAVSQLLTRAATSMPETTGGSNGSTVERLPVVGGYYLVVGVVVVVVLLTNRLVLRGRTGAGQIAVLANAQRAESLGIGPTRVQVLAFTVAAAVSAVAGTLFAQVSGIVTPASLGIALSTSVLAWLAVGGKRGLAGPFLGALVLTVIEQVFGGDLRSLYVFGLAILFIVVVSVAPDGVAGIVRRMLRGGSDMPRLPRMRAVRPRDGATGDAGAAIGERGERGAPGTPEVLLEVRNITQRLGRARILTDVSLTVHRGEIVALIGPNGAGKSTLLAAIAGSIRPERGEIVMNGHEITTLRPAQRARRGLGRMFQVPSVFAELSVADNRRLAATMAGESGPDSKHPGHEDDIAAGELSMAERRNLELDMVLAGPPELVLLDEPAAGLSHDDATSLAGRLRHTSAESGCAMIIVEHDMGLVREVADRVVVLAEGRVIAIGTMDEVAEHDAVRRAYLGGDA